MSNGSPAAGWYEDPRDAGRVRWWDGAGWTQHTQVMPSAPQPVVQESVAPVRPEIPVQPESQPQAQQPADPWAPAQPGQQWDQAQQPADQWGQPQQPGQQWGQPQQPADQWGQAQQPAEGGWQQQQPGAWGSAVPPGPVPGGIAPGSPMGQANVFPTAATVDPITGMPVAQGHPGSGSSGKRLAAVVVATLLVGMLILGLLWFFLFRDSDTQTSGTSTGPVEVTATFSGSIDPACADLGAALTADDLSSTVAQRLNDVAVAKDLEENQAYFEQLGRDIEPIMDQYRDACVAAVAAGGAPEFYRTFVESFEAGVTEGEDAATAALDDGGQVPAGDAEKLKARASALEASAEAVVAVSGAAASPSPTPSASASPSASGPGAIEPSPIG